MYLQTCSLKFGFFFFFFPPEREAEDYATFLTQGDCESVLIITGSVYTSLLSAELHALSPDITRLSPTSHQARRHTNDKSTWSQPTPFHGLSHLEVCFSLQSPGLVWKSDGNQTKQTCRQWFQPPHPLNQEPKKNKTWWWVMGGASEWRRHVSQSDVEKNCQLHH